ncbi:endolytic transglycosylase MltG [Derxia gummosa]|uniref:Endolytic murein transglycosylase n=1 Tax=Derxia gummosa DSM 723 TaxID=1121388 RepID=A0A8B6X8I9_9BURK|nr:endolytic transglycosylase MltG [Derxia gummosa]
MVAPRSRRHKARARAFFVAVVALLVLGGLAWVFTPINDDPKPRRLDIAAGQGLRGVAAGVEQATGANAWAFAALAKLSGNAPRLKAGSYDIEVGSSPWTLLRKLARGEVAQAQITIVEGWTLRQLRELLARSNDVLHDSAGLTDRELIEAIGARGLPGLPDAPAGAEGLFLPETYRFPRMSGEVAVLRMAHELLRKRLAEAWAARAPEVVVGTPYEALILASLVEKETGLAADRGRVAAVFNNRLRIGMPLQTDPSVIYGLGDAFDGNLRKRDLLADTPYNSYTRAGLPPTPIALVGVAALHPDATRALYFVSRGDGSSAFSETLEQHQRAVDRYLRRGKP